MGLTSGIRGSLGKRTPIKEQLKLLDQKRMRTQNEADRYLNMDATQRADTMALLSKMEESMSKGRKQAAAEEAMGASAEHRAMRNAANADALTSTMTNLAISNENRKDSLRQQYGAKIDAVDDEKRKLKGQMPSFWDTASAGLSGAMEGITAGTGWDWGESDKKKKDLGAG